MATESRTLTHCCGHSSAARLSGTAEEIAAKVAKYSGRPCHDCAHPAPVSRTVASAPGTLYAKYAGRCPRCGECIAVGEPIAWQPGGRAAHARCGDSGPRGYSVSRGPGRGHWVQDDESTDW